MSSLNECSICNEPYLFTTASRQALCLPCGHSACRSCLTGIHTAHCPSCRAPFTSNIATMAPNYTLHEALAANSASSTSVTTLSAIAAHVAVISAQVAVLQLDNTRRDVSATATNIEIRDIHILIRSLCSRLALPMESQVLSQPAQQQHETQQEQHQVPTQQPQSLFQPQQQLPHYLPVMNLSQSITNLQQNLSSTASHTQLELNSPSLSLQQQPLGAQQQLSQQQWSFLQQQQPQQQPLEQNNIVPGQSEGTLQTLQPPPGFPPLSPTTLSTTTHMTQAVQSSTSPPFIATGSSSISSICSISVAQGLTTTGPIVHCTSESLEALMLEINSSTAPTTFDLGGRTLYHQISDQPAASVVITASAITIRNGTLHQSDLNNDKTGPGLHVQGKSVRLESLVLIGGGYGVLVLPGASVKMSGCAVIGAHLGLGVGNCSHNETLAGVAKLEARDVKVSGCGGRGLSVGKGGQAKLQSCEFVNGGHHGMFVGGDSTSKLIATDVKCAGNQKRGLCVIAHGKAVLSRCVLTGNMGGSVFVQDLQSSIKHAQCVLDQFAEAKNGGYLHEVSSL